MITPRFGLMKYIPVFHPSGVALRSKSAPDGFVTKDFAKVWNNRVYFRLSNYFVDLTWVPQLNTDLALFLKRQGKARLAANGHSPWQKSQRRHGA
jgi:hypothetical protein